MSYTYVVVHKHTGCWYYGVRTSKHARPEDLWKTYFTSSKVIHAIIAKDGADVFSYYVRRTFDSPEKAIKWETRVLKRVLNRPKCLNESAFPVVSDISRKRGNNKKLLRDANGLNAYDRATLTWKNKRNLINPDTGNTFAEDCRLRAQNTRNNAPEEIKQHRRERAKLSVKRMHTTEARTKAHASLRKRVAEGTFPTTKGRKFPSISEKLKGRQFTLGLVWANDGSRNYRLNPNDELLKTLNLGRLVTAGAAAKGYKQEIVQCPHCSKSGAITNMKRYHFENCKTIK